MAYIRKEEAAELPRIKVVYAEAGFECVSLVPPGADLLLSVKLGMQHGLEQASKQLGLPKKHLQALPSGPLSRDDGSPIPAEEWARHNFIVVQMKPEKTSEGLLGMYRRQHDYLDQLIREKICASGSKPATDEEKTLASKLETTTVTEKKVETLEKEKEEVATLKERVKTLEEKVRNLEEENKGFKEKVRNLEEENKGFKEKVRNLEEEIEGFMEENKGFKEEIITLKTTITNLQIKISELSGMERIMMRKMLDRCRKKCLLILKAANVDIPHDWHEVIEDPTCMQLLHAAGLSVGLAATRYGKNSQQEKGSKAAHDVTESPEAYATIVCKLSGSSRERMLNVFQFVFERSAEDLVFDDEF